MDSFKIKDLGEYVRLSSIASTDMPIERNEADLDLPLNPRAVYDGISQTVANLNNSLDSSVFHVTPRPDEFDAVMQKDLKFGYVEVSIHFTPRGSKEAHLVSSFKIATAKIPDTIPETGHTVPGHFSLHGITAADPLAIETIIFDEMGKLTRRITRQRAERVLSPHLFMPTKAGNGQ